MGHADVEKRGLEVGAQDDACSQQRATGSQDHNTTTTTTTTITSCNREPKPDLLQRVTQKIFSDPAGKSRGRRDEDDEDEEEQERRDEEEDDEDEDDDEDLNVSEATKMVASREDWFASSEHVPWTTSKIGVYNPVLKVFKCADCESCIGFLARVAEHWLGTHANMRVFQCPRCPYNSAWARCVRMHYTRAHEPHGDLPETLMWKSSPILVQVDTLLTNLKADVEASVKVSTTSETTNESHQPALQKPVPATRGKRSSKSRSRQHRDGGDDGAASRGLAGAVRKYACGYCSYSTDRRDLFTRHENIHKEEKPFVCFVCAKQFNRADHVKKHFLRIHPDVPYDIKMIRRKPGSTCEDPQVAAAMRNVPTGRKSFQLLMAGNKLGKTKEMESTMKKEDFLFPGPEITISRHMAPIVAPVLHLAAVPTRPPVPDLIYMPKFTPTALAINHFPLFPVAHGKPRPAKKAKLKPDPVPKTSPKKKPTAALLDDDATRIRPSTTTTTTNGSDEKRFTCSFCPWTGVDSWCLKRHLNTHVKPYTCPMCDYKAARMERLQLHVGRVHCKKICSKCSQLFDMQDDLMKHVEEEHVKLGQRPPKTVCLECGTVLDSRSSLETHMIIVHRGSLLKCSLCDFCTADPATMDAHCSQRHSKPVVDLADIDGKKAELWSGQGLLFYQQALATLPASIGSDSGKEVSSDEKPSRKRKHSGERTTEVYKCDQCSEEYSRRIGLLLHKLGTHAEPPFDCSGCSETFDRLPQLLMHLKSSPSCAN